MECHAVHRRERFEPIGLTRGENRPSDSGRCRQLTKGRGCVGGSGPDRRAGHARNLRRQLQVCNAAAHELLVCVAEIELVERTGYGGREIHGRDGVGVRKKVDGPAAKVEVVLWRSRQVVERDR
jgi:hypothetical protein